MGKKKTVEERQEDRLEILSNTGRTAVIELQKQMKAPIEDYIKAVQNGGVYVVSSDGNLVSTTAEIGTELGNVKILDEIYPMSELNVSFAFTAEDMKAAIQRRNTNTALKKAFDLVKTSGLSEEAQEEIKAVLAKHSAR